MFLISSNKIYGFFYCNNIFLKNLLMIIIIVIPILIIIIIIIIIFNFTLQIKFMVVF
jgi:hypothetical protein